MSSSRQARFFVLVELGGELGVHTRIDPEALDLDPQGGDVPLRVMAAACRDRGRLEGEADGPRRLLAHGVAEARRVLG